MESVCVKLHVSYIALNVMVLNRKFCFPNPLVTGHYKHPLVIVIR